MTTRAVVSMLLAWAVPGSGHMYLGRVGRGIAFFTIVVTLFVVGLSIDGSLFTLASSRGSWLRAMASYASMGSGFLYLIASRIGFAGDIVSDTFEYGSAFMLTAGLMNLLLVLDCYDIAHDRKVTISDRNVTISDRKVGISDRKATPEPS